MPGSDSVQKKVKDTKIKLFSKQYNLEFFGALSYKFDWKITDMPESAEGCVRFNIKTHEVDDGKIHVNKKFIESNNYTAGNLLALISHELMHILEKHSIRRGNRYPMIWNFATDHVIDRNLKKIFSSLPNDIEPYKGNYNVIDRLEQEKPNCSAEDAYDWLKQNVEFKKITISCSGGNGEEDDGEGSGQQITIKDEETGQEITVNFDEQSQNGGSEKEKQKTKEIIENFVSQARALYETMKSKGSVPAGMQEQLDEILKVDIPWEELLEKAIKRNTILKPDERSWRELNKYYYPQGITLPGYSLTEENEAVGHLIIAADSSGSISSDNLKQWASVLMESMKYFKTIYLLVHDVNVHQVVEFEKDDTQKFYDFIQNQGFQGRGGTSHKPVFDYIEETHWADNDMRDSLSMVICLTDAMSDIEQIFGEYDFIKNNTPIIFTVNTNWNFDPGYGDVQVIHINDGK